MTDIALIFSALSLLSALMAAALPERFAWPVLTGAGALGLAIWAPLSLLWLLALAALVRTSAYLAGRGLRSGPIVAAVTLLAATALLVLREIPDLFWIGGAYFTLRNLHVLFDWWLSRYPMPSWTALLRYNLFPPVLIAGPIHRFPDFQREWERRRVTVADIGCGAERMLFGLGSAVILGGWMLGEAMAPLIRQPSPGFGQQWALSALEWVQLYFVFSGLSSLAIGAARISGLRIEENFNQPWRARNLVDFWSRWHITLSHWCRDYVYHPVAIAARSPIAGVFAAMIVLGLWHESSIYYLLWALWQATGILGSHLIARRLPPRQEMRIFAPVLILGWLSLARPFLSALLNWEMT